MKRLLFITTMITFVAVPALSDIIGISGDVAIDTLPKNLFVGNYESNTTATVFEEQHNLTLQSALWLDLAASFDYTMPAIGLPSTSLGGVVPAGSTINSHIVHLDPIGTTGSISGISGEIEFSNMILGVIVTKYGTDTSYTLSGLGGETDPGSYPWETDKTLGIALTNYPAWNPYRGLEEGDHIWLIDPYTLAFDLNASGTYVNEFRIITTPIPGAVLLGLLGLSVAGVKLRRFA